MASERIDINELAGHAAADLIESFFTKVGLYTKDQIQQFKIRFGKGFSRYLSGSVRRYSTFKTILNRYEPVEIDDYYVPCHFQIEEKTYRDDDFFDLVDDHPRLIVEGTAGLGKTVFMRHLFRSAILEHYNRIPILFELRYLQLNKEQTLLSHLVDQIAVYIPGFAVEHLQFGLQQGKFILFLDGLDEIAFEERTRYGSEILDLCYRYTQSPLIMSTRRDDFYQPWETFSIAKLQPMKSRPNYFDVGQAD